MVNDVAQILTPNSILGRMPPEIWTRIFQYTSEPHRPWEMVIVLLVCKTWKASAEAALFEHVQIKSELHLRRFYTWLCRRQRRDEDVGMLVKHLYINLGITGEKMSDYTWNAVMSLPFLVSQLRSFELSGRATMPCHLRCLLACTADTLNSLTLEIREGYNSVFLLLNRLRALRVLKITCTTTNRWSIDQSQPLSLENVKHFRWTWEEKCENGAMVNFLTKCRFATGGSFTIAIPRLLSPDAPALIPFLDHHHLREITVDMNKDSILALAEPLARIRDLHFLHCVPPVALVDRDNWPHALSVHVRYDYPEPLYDLLDYFLNLYARPDVVPTTLRSIRIGIAGGEVPFTWGCADDMEDDFYAIFTGRLMHYAIKLHKRGFNLLDSEGKDVKSCFS